MLSSEPIFRIHAELGEIMELGATPYGGRRLIPILGGRVEGPKLKGRILPGGADWQIILANGVTDIQARYSIETDAGARVIVHSDGMRHGPREVLEAIARGEQVAASRYYFRTVMRFESGDSARAWVYPGIA